MQARHDEIAEIVRQVLREQQQASPIVTDAATLKIVSGILTAFGINDDDRMEIRKDFAYLRRWRKTAETVERGWWIAIVGIFVSGTASAIYLGIKSILGK